MNECTFRFYAKPSPYGDGMKLNITARLVLGNTFAIVAVVGSYGYFNAQRIESIFAEEAERETSARMDDLRQRGLSEARRVASNTAFALSNNDFGYLENALKPLVEADEGVAFAFLVDQDDALIAQGSRTDVRIPASVIEAEKRRPLTENDAREVVVSEERVVIVNVPISTGDRHWGRVVLGYSLRRLQQQLAALEQWRSEEIRSSLVATVVFAVVLAFIGIVATVLPSISVTQPIITLTQAAERLAEGELGLAVNVRARGELGLLGSTFNRMSAQLADLVSEVKVKAAMEKELEVAESVQSALIPEPRVHRTEGVEVYGRYIPASQCGGDWWSYFHIGPGQTLVLVGDVTGHGVPTTLMTASVNACCDELQRTNVEMKCLGDEDGPALRSYLAQRGSLSYLLSHLNRSIAKVGRGQFLMTFSAALLDTKAHQLSYASAGHEPALLLRGEGRQVEALHVGPSVRLGECSTAKFEEQTYAFGPGDTIVWYTDGLLDAVNPKQRSYGDGRLLRNLRKYRAEQVDSLAEKVVSDVLAYAEGRAIPDDVTLVVARNTAGAE